MEYLVVAIGSVITSLFLYMTGRIHGSEKEKGKQNEKGLDVVQRASNARTNANIEQLRKRYKNK